MARDINWIASRAEAEALGMAEPDQLTAMFRSRSAPESNETTPPMLTVTVGSRDAQTQESFEFDLTGWENALIPLIAECDEASGRAAS